MARLTKQVYVDGVLYGPDSDVPADVAEAITNPKAWEDESDKDESSKSTRRAAPKAK